jgi:hypothetical protein
MTESSAEMPCVGGLAYDVPDGGITPITAGHDLRPTSGTPHA